MAINENIPNEVVLASVDDAAKCEKDIVSTHVELCETLQRLKDECKKEIRSAIGKEKSETYEKVHEKAKQRLADIASSTQHTTEGLKLSSQMRRQILNESKRSISRLGIEAMKIKKIQKKFKNEAEAAVERALLGHEEAPYVDLSDAEAPTLSHNPWEWRSTPYYSQWGTHWSYGTRGWRWSSHSENRWTGGINCWSSMNIHGADDSDYTYTNSYSELRFWFRMPAAGMVEVWLYLQAVDTPYGGCLWDEWGWSDASIRQRSRPYLRVISPYSSYRFGTLLDYRRGEYEGCWAGTIAGAGYYRYAHHFSLGTYAAGQWCLCAVGIQDYNYFWVNDMSCNTYITSRWFLKNVAVRSTGAP